MQQLWWLRARPHLLRTLRSAATRGECGKHPAGGSKFGSIGARTSFRPLRYLAEGTSVHLSLQTKLSPDKAVALSGMAASSPSQFDGVAGAGRVRIAGGVLAAYLAPACMQLGYEMRETPAAEPVSESPWRPPMEAEPHSAEVLSRAGSRDGGSALAIDSGSGAIVSTMPDGGSSKGLGGGTAGTNSGGADASSAAAPSGPSDAGEDATYDASPACHGCGQPDGAPTLEAGTTLPPARDTVFYECAQVVSGNTENSGTLVSAEFYSGFRFEVRGTSLAVQSAGLNATSFGAGSVFGSIVALTGRTDWPDSPDLTGDDVVTTFLVDLPGGPDSVTALGPVSATLPPGWYALLFGTGAFGATLNQAVVHRNSGTGGCLNGTYPMTLRQSDGDRIHQASTPHFQVRGTMAQDAGTGG